MDIADKQRRRVRRHESNETRKQNSYEKSLLFMYNFPSGRIYFTNVSWSWKLQEVVFGYEATFVREKEPSFFVVVQYVSIETSFRVIGIQIFYPRHPGLLSLSGYAKGAACGGWLERNDRARTRKTEGKVNGIAGGETGRKGLKGSKGKERRQP